MTSRARYLLFLLVLLVPGCSDRCIRHSDCQGGLICVQGQCVQKGQDMMMDMGAPAKDAAGPVVDMQASDLASIGDLGDAGGG